MAWLGRKPRVRRRDSWTLATGSHRRKVRKYGGLTNRQYKKVVKGNRRYKKYGIEP